MKKLLILLTILLMSGTCFATSSIQEKEYVITESQKNIILEYLSKKPYVEVYQGIEMLIKLKEKGRNDTIGKN